MDSSRHLVKGESVGDAAVQGLFAGIAAGFVMAAAVLLMEVAAGVAPLTVLGYFDATAHGSPLTGLLVHFAVSGVYGAGFGLFHGIVTRAAGLTNRWTWIAFGVVYGLLIFGVAQVVILPRTPSGLRDVPVVAFGFAHVLYGLVLGLLDSRTGD